MDALFARLSPLAPYALAALRIMAGLLFLAHGTQKLFGFPPSNGPAPELLSLRGIGGVIEIATGALIALGLFTRPAASWPPARWRWPTSCSTRRAASTRRSTGATTAILFCFIFLYLVTAAQGAEPRWASPAV